MENPDINRNLYVTITFSCIKTRTKTFFIQNKIIENFPYLNTLTLLRLGLLTDGWGAKSPPSP